MKRDLFVAFAGLGVAALVTVSTWWAGRPLAVVMLTFLSSYLIGASVYRWHR